MQELPDIDERLCTGCGDCLPPCPTQCLIVTDRGRGVPVLTAAADCIACHVCAVVCPVGAIAMRVQDW